MSETLRRLEDLWYCISWIFTGLIENCVDLKVWKLPSHPNDLLWYAERVNGRLAMLTLVIVLHLEFFCHASIWKIIGVHNGIG
jgi:hypothetical protein